MINQYLKVPWLWSVISRLFLLLIFKFLIWIGFCYFNFDFVLCFMIDCFPLWLPWLPKVIKFFIHQLRTYVCAKEYVLQDEFLQTGSILWACSILSSDGIIYIWFAIERFMIYFMKYLMDISLYHSHEYRFWS